MHKPYKHGVYGIIAREGMVTITPGGESPVVPDAVVLLIDENGNGTIEGATLIVDESGNGIIPGMSMSVDVHGNGTLYR